MPPTPLTIRPLEPRDREPYRSLMEERWGSTTVVSRGRSHDLDAREGIVATRGGQTAGYLTFRVDAEGLEIVTLDALRPRAGVGRPLIEEAQRVARERGCPRVWSITTNDNLPAQAFYEAVGFERVAVHVGAVDEARRLKPEIPEIGVDGVPVRDEIEYARAVAR